METVHPRIQREQITLDRMIRLYCQKQHASTPGSLCPTCQGLLDYAIGRLKRCPFQERKPTCAKCTVHCYKPVMREQVRKVMRFSGPRMLYCHPVLAVLHLLDGLRKPPILKK